MKCISLIKKKAGLTVLVTSILLACNKQDEWLDMKTNNYDVVPSKLKDFQALLDNTNEMNKNYPSIGITSADNYYLTDLTWQSMPLAQDRNAYKWAPDIFEGESTPAWNNPYKIISISNIVLEGLKKIDKTSANEKDWHNIRGCALFFRGYAHYILAQLFCKQYDAADARNNLGIPIRTTDNVNDRSTRSSLQAVFDQILHDLKEAEAILPNDALLKTRPSKASANAALAKVYLHMDNYALALQHAQKSLSIVDTLIDFNALNATSTRPFANFQNNNIEVLFYAQASTASHLRALIVDSLLVNSYQEDDLRKTVFYGKTTNGYSFKGQYTGLPTTFFSGININEIYLIKSEAEAQTGNIEASMQTLNTLLEKRWLTSKFVPYKAGNLSEALTIIYSERKKELPFTGTLRWEDLKRLNRNPQFATTITRTLQNQTHTLLPNDNRYVLPIPPDEIRLTGIEQNQR